MTSVKNINGTSQKRYAKPKDGSSSWKEYWEKHNDEGCEFGLCGNMSCYDRKADVGGHVVKVNSRDQKWYIVPLCSSCNQLSDDEIFKVPDNFLVPVNEP